MFHMLNPVQHANKLLEAMSPFYLGMQPEWGNIHP